MNDYRVITGRLAPSSSIFAILPVLRKYRLGATKCPTLINTPRFVEIHIAGTLRSRDSTFNEQPVHSDCLYFHGEFCFESLKIFICFPRLIVPPRLGPFDVRFHTTGTLDKIMFLLFWMNYSVQHRLLLLQVLLSKHFIYPNCSPRRCPNSECSPMLCKSRAEMTTMQPSLSHHP